MTEQATEPNGSTGGPSLAATGIGILALVAGVAGAQAIETGTRPGITGGVLLVVAALGFAAVAVGGRPYGPAIEGALDVSARIGLGVLGGLLGGLLHGLLTEIAGSVGLTLLLGVGIDIELSGAQWMMRALYGSAWGLALGVFYPVVPGAGFGGKGATFSLLPTLYQSFFVYPVLLGLGVLGVRQGVLTFPFVLIGNLFAGIAAAWVISWGETSDLAPVSDPLVD
jgi:hypothetical protein